MRGVGKMVKYVTTANTGNTVTVYHLRNGCSCLHGSETREIDGGEINRRNLDLCGQCDRLANPESTTESQDWSAYRAAAEHSTDSSNSGKLE